MNDGTEVTVRLLLVEDLAQVREVMLDTLSLVGSFAMVHCAGTEAEANLWLEDHQGGWDLAVIDLVLDQGSGLSVVPRAHKLAGPGARVVVLSEFVTEGMRKHCLRIGADQVFQKSTQMKSFLDYCTAVAQGRP